MHYYINPEVSPTLGIETEIDRSTHPPIVSKLHLHFDGWLGDDLVKSFPCYAITERLKNILIESNFTGFEIDSLKVTKSEIFDELSPYKELPKFYWLKINGKCGEDDFGIKKDRGLVISERVKKVLDKLNKTKDAFENTDLEKRILDKLNYNLSKFETYEE